MHAAPGLVPRPAKLHQGNNQKTFFPVAQENNRIHGSESARITQIRIFSGSSDQKNGSC